MCLCLRVSARPLTEFEDAFFRMCLDFANLPKFESSFLVWGFVVGVGTQPA